MTTEPGPIERLRLALAEHPNATYVRVEVIDLRAALSYESDHGPGDGCACYDRGFDHGLTEGERHA